MASDEHGTEAPRGAVLRAAQAVAARLCHDMSGEAGALAGLLTPATGGAAVPDEELALAAELAASLAARVRLLRFVFAGPGDPAGRDALLGHLRAIPLPSRVRLEVDGLDTTEPAPELATLAACLGLFAVACARGSGTVRLAFDGADLLVTMDGPRAAWPAELPDWLDAPDAALAALDEPRMVAGPYAALLAAAAGYRLSVLLDAAGDAPPPLLASRA